MTTLFILSAILGVGSFYCIKKEKQHNFLILTLLSVFVFSVYLYREYLFGQAQYLYSTSDGFSQFFPRYMEFVRAVRSGDFPAWSMSIGFGMMKNYGFLLYPLNLLPIIAGVFWGETALMHGFAWMQVLKMVLAALFLYLFLKKLGLSGFSSFIAAYVYSFNGVMVLRGFWVFFADECYLAVLLLYVTELYFKENKWYFIPPAVFLVAICLDVYYVYLYAFILIIYGTVRYFYDGRPARKYLRFLLICGCLYAVGVFLSGISLVNYIWEMITAARFSGTIGGFSSTFQQWRVAYSVIASAIFSVFDPNVTGVFEQYTGVLNYLERPLFYCGIGSLYFIVQGMTTSDKRMRRLIVLGFVFAAAYMFFTPITDIFNAFIRNMELSARSYRLSSLWILILMVVIAAYGLELGVRRKRFCGSMAVGTFVLFISGILLMRSIADYFGMTIVEPLYLKCVIMICAWAGVLVLASLVKREAVFVSVLCLIAALCAFELSSCANTTIIQSIDYSMRYQTDMQEDVFGYYGDVNEAIDAVQEVDPGLYRVSGVRPNVGATTFCVPQYFDFIDSCYYLSVSESNYTFLNELYPESFTTGVGTKCSVGVGNDRFLSALTGYKYWLIDNTVSYKMPIGYSLHMSSGEIDILENQNPLSFGLTYDSYMTESEFSKYENEERKRMLLSTVVVADDMAETLPFEHANMTILGGIDDIEGFYNTMVKERSEEMLMVTSWSHDELYGTICVSSPKVLSFSIANDPGWEVYVDGEKTDTFVTNLGFFGVLLDEGEHNIMLSYSMPLRGIGVITSLVALAVYLSACIFRKKLTPFMEVK